MTNDSLKAKLVAIANLLADLTGAVAEVAAEFGEVTKVEPEPQAEKSSEPLPTLEEVRSVLAEISRSGKTAEMKALLSKFGAAKLSDIKPEDYPALLKAAEEVKNA